MNKISLLKSYILLFAVIFILFVSTTYRDYKIDLEKGTYRRLMPSGDVIPNTFLPYSIIEQHSIYFDEMKSTIRLFDANKERPYYIIVTNDRFVSAYPMLTGVMALPIYFVPLLLNKIPELSYHENLLKVLLLGRISASFYASLSVVIMFAILGLTTPKKSSIKEKVKGMLSKHFTHKKLSFMTLPLLFTLFYAFGTSTYSVSSRGLWQHTTSQFWISMAVLFLLVGFKNKKVVPWVGLVLGLAVITRPTNIILALVLTPYIYLNYKKYFLKFVLLAGFCAFALLIFNSLVFDSPFIEGYGARNDFNWSTPLSTSLPAYAVSPARSYLFTSPILVLGFVTIIKIFKDKNYKKKHNQLYRYLAVGFLLSVLMFAKWYTWHGAPAFGTRMLSDYLPIIGLFSYEFIKDLPKKYLPIIALLIIYSILIHFNAVYFRKSRCSPDHDWSFYCLKPPTREAQY